MPAEDAIKYMKDAAEHSYLKKGRDVVEKNWNAIDAGATAYVKVDVPASWATAEDNKAASTLEGPADTVKVVETILNPIGKMDGYSLPVSAFESIADGQFPLGASAYEKRGVAVTVPHWDETKCICFRLREARRCRDRSSLGRDQVHPVQQLFLCLPPRYHPSLRSDR